MRTRLGSTALAAGIIAASAGVAAPTLAQTSVARADSSHRFALFGGTAATERFGPESGLEMGVSADLRWHPVPVPLRLSLSFSQRNGGYGHSTMRGGLASLEAVMRPIPKRFGIQPYFLAGLGVGTHAAHTRFTGALYYPPLVTEAPASLFVRMPRETWAFASAGAGLDVGRAFIQVRLLNPVASDGAMIAPINVGFRFWD